MALTDNDKTQARDALSLALELNEPETMIEGLRRLCERKLGDLHISDHERDRWQSARQALNSVATELERANAPQTRANDAPAAQTS